MSTTDRAIFPRGSLNNVLASVSEKCPPFHVTDDDVEPSIDVEYLEVDTIVAHQLLEDGVGRSRPYTRHTGSDWPVRPGKERWICNVSAVPFFSIGQENQFNVATPAINVTATCD